MITWINISIRPGDISTPLMMVRLKLLEWVVSSDSSALTCKSTFTEINSYTKYENYNGFNKF